jgi:hypothetical protein
MWFGWGTKHKYWDLEDGRSLLCVYKYTHLMFVIRFITSKRWFLQGERRSEDRELSADEVYKMLGELPKVSAYRT